MNNKSNLSFHIHQATNDKHECRQTETNISTNWTERPHKHQTCQKRISKQFLMPSVYFWIIMYLFVVISVLNKHQRIWIARRTSHLLTVTKYHPLVWSSLLVIIHEMKLAIDSINKWQINKDKNPGVQTRTFTNYTADNWK